jgi:predicted nicotinamide N-methyase
VIVGDPGRQFAPTGGFSELAIYDVPTTVELEDAEVKRTAVWDLRP